MGRRRHYELVIGEDGSAELRFRDGESGETPPEHDDTLLGPPLSFPRFVVNQVITADDLNEITRYLDGQARRHNRLLHGAGIVHGLEIKKKRRQLRIAPGLAFDCLGRELILAEAVRIDLPPDGDELTIALSYRELMRGPNRVVESSELRVARDAPCRKHATIGKRRWKACGEAHPVPLATIAFRRGKWRLRPCCKQRSAS